MANAAPERIELPNGCYWESYGFSGFNGAIKRKDGLVLFSLDKVVAQAMAAAMRPVPSESDEAVAAILVEEFISFRHDIPAEEIAAHIAPLLARHRERAVVEVEHQRDQYYGLLKAKRDEIAALCDVLHEVRDAAQAILDESLGIKVHLPDGRLGYGLPAGGKAITDFRNAYNRSWQVENTLAQQKQEG